MKGFAVLYAFIFLQSMFLLLLQKNKSISADLTVKSCRAYFELDADVPESNNAPSIIIDYGDESTSLREISNEQLVISNEQLVISNYDYYTLDGRKLDGKPTKKGMYINKGRQVVIK